jgi:hypothetical protein
VVNRDDRTLRSCGYSDDVCVKHGGRWRIKERAISSWDEQSLPWPETKG